MEAMGLPFCLSGQEAAEYVTAMRRKETRLVTQGSCPDPQDIYWVVRAVPHFIIRKANSPKIGPLLLCTTT
jgi:hypothetical protein